MGRLEEEGLPALATISRYPKNRTKKDRYAPPRRKPCWGGPAPSWARDALEKSAKTQAASIGGEVS